MLSWASPFAGGDMNQPRVPAGSPEGGQWTGKGGATSSRGDYLAITGKVEPKIYAPHAQKMARAKQASDSVDRARKLLKDKGMDVDHLNVIITDRMPRGLPPMSIGGSDMDRNQIYLDVGQRYYDRIYDNQKELFDAGMHSSGHKDHVIVHEMAHQLHREKEVGLLPSQRSGGYFGLANVGIKSEEAKKIARQVSRYAEENPHEFVVETFTGAILGKRVYSEEVKLMYTLLNGPNPDLVFGGKK